MRNDRAKSSLCRRSVLTRLVQLACSGATLSALTSVAFAQVPSGAKTAPGNKCDLSSLTSADKALRESFEYAEKSPFGSAKDCLNCMYYMQPQGSFCGGCTILRGEVNPKGWCSQWE